MYRLKQKSLKYRRFCTKYKLFRIRAKNFQNNMRAFAKKKLSIVKSFVKKKVSVVRRNILHIHHVNADGYGQHKIKPLPSSRVQLRFEKTPIRELKGREYSV